MAKFIASKKEAQDFNDDVQFVKGDKVKAETVNNLVEGTLYAQNVSEQAKVIADSAVTMANEALDGVEELSTRDAKSNALGLVYASTMGSPISFGKNATSQGTSSISMGSNVTVQGVRSVGIGGSVYGSNSIGVGNGTNTINGDNRIVFGTSATTSLECAVTTITSLSDERTKEDITYANTARCLEIVEQIPLKRFKFKKYARPNPLDNHKLGFIAQDD